MQHDTEAPHPVPDGELGAIPAMLDVDARTIPRAFEGLVDLLGELVYPTPAPEPPTI